MFAGVQFPCGISVPFGALALDDYSVRPMVFDYTNGRNAVALGGAKSHLPIMLLHADRSENAFALRGQIRDDIGSILIVAQHVCPGHKWALVRYY